MKVFKQVESGVRSYCRNFPVIFQRAENATLYADNGEQYTDLLAGAGSLNYGHNNPELKKVLLDYIADDGITHGLDFHTGAKEHFLEMFRSTILEPRGMDHLVQFTGPTGSNAVEAALKIARKVTGRSTVVAFTNGFHGCTLGSLAATGNQHHRGGAGVTMSDVFRMPYANYFGDEANTLDMFEKMLDDPSSGLDHPAAVILEAVQGEGGLNVASDRWLQRLEKICRSHDMLLILDDIQAGCGRTGTFFSFEPAGIKPDIITLSKSLSGYGLPFAVTLIREKYDVWQPGEHNGTFRGNNHAFITAARALELYWSSDEFAASVREKGELLADRLGRIAQRHKGNFELRGRGMMRGLACPNGDIASAVVKYAFKHNVIIETSGAHDEVVKVLCPLTIPHEQLDQALAVVAKGFDQAMERAVSLAS